MASTSGLAYTYAIDPGSGLALGLALALVLGDVLSSLLYQVTPQDPFTLGGAALLLFAFALGASWLPCRRAAQVDPMETIRDGS